MKIFINGRSQEVFVDDFVPVNQDGLPVFAIGADKCLWPMLLEKAWAKLHGSYCMIRKGYASMAFSHLTGAATERIDHNFLDDDKKLWSKLKHANLRNFLVACCSYENDGVAEKSSERVVSSHVH